MKWNMVFGALVVSVGLCSQSYGFELLDRMLGLNDCGCNSCCQKSCEPACGCDKGWAPFARTVPMDSVTMTTTASSTLILRAPAHVGAPSLRWWQVTDAGLTLDRLRSRTLAWRIDSQRVLTGLSSGPFSLCNLNPGSSQPRRQN